MEPNTLLRPGDTLDAYRIDEPFYDQDGPIQCYLATDTRVDRQVKIQCIDSVPFENTPQRAERFHAVAARLRALSNPLLPTFYDGGVKDRIYWAATEHDIGYPTLGSVLNDPDERLSVQSCFIVAHQIAGALRAAHGAGIMHLRLSPDRILLDRATRSLYKINDVGVAQLFSMTPDFIRSDPHYAAPEQLRDGAKPIDERADIYAFGMVLYSLFTWTRPFADKDDNLPGIDKLLLYAMTKTPSPLGERLKPCPDFLDVFVQVLMAKSPANRPPNFGAVCERLSEVAARHVVWGEALDEIGRQDPATKQTLIAALRGPAPEGAELQTLLARLTETKLLTPAQKRKKPQSGKRPSAALRAAIEGYQPADSGNEAANRTPEPEWFATLPDEPESSEVDGMAHASKPDAVLVAVWDSVIAALDASRRAPTPSASVDLPSKDDDAPLVEAMPSKPASIAAPSVPCDIADLNAAPRTEPPALIRSAVPSSPNRGLPGTPPPNALRRPPPQDEPHADTVRDPVPPAHLEPDGSTQEAAPLDPVTLPSGELGRQMSTIGSAPRRPAKRAALAVAVAFAASLTALLLVNAPRKPPTPARSASLGAASVPELRAPRVATESSAPVVAAPAPPQIGPSGSVVVPRPQGARPSPRVTVSAPSSAVAAVASASASATGSALPVVPTATPTAQPATNDGDEDPCKKFVCPFKNQEHHDDDGDRGK